ncbi:hypothetical protein H257_00384 [Aphanomyces astaci]|uniref:Uncharacterized protein n=1 Tax=Aphanomyces astaci TaxID=112090 RepID=W4HBK4_APHAT|nr:hypothetical protein H257_00384 [Aphanomyces astaci]ETV88951.1 hypothetical protein H257_00384 [Aphanomyces astaci]|eukprot:XP_009821351.1 hypothetical protein H257_00384 [Aphanomyces astaci]
MPSSTKELKRVVPHRKATHKDDPKAKARRATISGLFALPQHISNNMTGLAALAVQATLYRGRKLKQD